MTPNMVADICREALYLILKVIGPVMLIGLAVGIVLSLFQALTQIQEPTLTFIPKIIVIFASLLLFGSYMTSSVNTYTEKLFLRIRQLE